MNQINSVCVYSASSTKIDPVYFTAAETLGRLLADHHIRCLLYTSVLHRNTGKIEHRMFKDVLDYFDDKDVFIFNDKMCIRDRADIVAMFDKACSFCC